MPTVQIIEYGPIDKLRVSDDDGKSAPGEGAPMSFVKPAGGGSLGREWPGIQNLDWCRGCRRGGVSCSVALRGGVDPACCERSASEEPACGYSHARDDAKRHDVGGGSPRRVVDGVDRVRAQCGRWRAGSRYRWRGCDRIRGGGRGDSLCDGHGRFGEVRASQRGRFEVAALTVTLPFAGVVSHRGCRRGAWRKGHRSGALRGRAALGCGVCPG